MEENELFAACRTDDLERVQRLVAAHPGLDLNQRLPEGYALAPLHVAVLSRSNRVAGFLIGLPGVDCGWDDDAQLPSPLVLVILYSNTELLGLMLNRHRPQRLQPPRNCWEVIYQECRADCLRRLVQEPWIELQTAYARLHHWHDGNLMLTGDPFCRKQGRSVRKGMAVRQALELLGLRMLSTLRQRKRKKAEEEGGEQEGEEEERKRRGLCHRHHHKHPTKLLDACWRAGLSRVRELIEEEGYDPNWQDPEDNSCAALHVAILARDLPLLRYLLLEVPGIDRSLRLEDKDPLHLACLQDFGPGFRLLLQTLDPPPQQELLANALCRAASYASEGVLAVLLRDIPRLDLGCDSAGNRCLWFLSLTGWDRGMQMLLANPAGYRLDVARVSKLTPLLGEYVASPRRTAARLRLHLGWSTRAASLLILSLLLEGQFLA